MERELVEMWTSMDWIIILLAVSCFLTPLSRYGIDLGATADFNKGLAILKNVLPPMEHYRTSQFSNTIPISRRWHLLSHLSSQNSRVAAIYLGVVRRVAV